MTALILCLLSVLLSLTAGAGVVYILFTLSKQTTNEKLSNRVNEILDDLLQLDRKISRNDTLLSDLKDVVETRYTRMAVRETRRNKAEEEELQKQQLEISLKQYSQSQYDLLQPEKDVKPLNIKPKLQKVR